MMRGPKPTPPALTKVKGNPGRRPIKEAADGFGDIGEPPSDLTDHAALKWAEAASDWRLVLTASDRDALRLYCEVWAEMLNAQRRVADDGAMILTPNGMVMKSPWMTKLEHCREFCRKMLAEFGGSPSARTRVALRDDGDEQDPAAKYFN